MARFPRGREIARTKAPAETPGPTSPEPPRLGQRATTIVDDGDYAGTQAVVDQIIAWPLFALASTKYQAFLDATAPADELSALQSVVDLYVSRARPVWSIEDLRGPVPAAASDVLLRVPVALIQTLFVLWLATFPQAEPATED